MDVVIEPLTLRLREPLHTAFGSVRERELLLLRLGTADGLTGVGEAAPLEPYDGVSIDAARAALEACRPLLAAGEDRDRDALLAACGEAAALPQALAAVDLALWDLAGKRAGRPVAALLAARPASRVEINATIGAAPPERAGALAAAAARDGVRCVKVKVGTGDDVERVAAVRGAVGAGVALRVDANGAWSIAEAVAALRALAPFELELAEEPVHGVAALREVRAAVEVPIAMDETAAEPGAVGSGAADAVCLKLARCGGISATLAAARAARKAGSTVYLASSLDGPAGIAGALHAAAAIGPDHASGLATLAMFADPQAPFAVRDGAIAIPGAPGLGVTPLR